MQKRIIIRWLIRYGILGALGGMSLAAFGGGFQLLEESVSGQGNAYAGVGATAQDASTEFYNPAGMTLLKDPALSISTVAIDLNIHSTIQSANNSAIDTLPLNNNISGSNPVTGAASADVGGWVFVPATHFVYPQDNWAFGFGITVPYGLETNYPTDSMARFLATGSELQVINIGPSVAYQLTPKLSLGLGFDLQYLSATLNQQVDLFVVDPLDPSQTAFYEGSLHNSGGDWGYGWNGGLLYQFTSTTRAGLAYRSAVDHNVSGSADINVPSFVLNGSTINLTSEGVVSGAITVPASTDLSFYHDINSQWAVVAGIDYTQWSELQSVTLSYSGGISNVIQSATLPLNFQDTLRYALGLNYRANDKLILRSGLAFDESPVRDSSDRTFRLPDANRVWLALGTHYKFNDLFSVDLGYAHLFVAKSSIDQTQTVSGTLNTQIPIPYQQTYNAIGVFTSSVNEFGLQLNWNL